MARLDATGGLRPDEGAASAASEAVSAGVGGALASQPSRLGTVSEDGALCADVAGACEDAGETGARAGDLRIAAIDLGTVSSRLLCATMRDGAILNSTKHTVITDLGAGVDATGLFAPEAVERVVAACTEFVREAEACGAQAVCTTLTSAARDVSNGEELLARLRALGLKPQVIPGEVEARLTFYGVAHDFYGRRIAVADSGGGSTELVVGSCGLGCESVGLGDGLVDAGRGLVDVPVSSDFAPRDASVGSDCAVLGAAVDGEMLACESSGPVATGEALSASGTTSFALECARSLDIGCRRVTERFFSAMPPAPGEIDQAVAWMRPHFDAYWDSLAERPDCLVAVGGTVTSLSALALGLETYDSHVVHLSTLTLEQVESAIEQMRVLSVEEIAELAGIQAKRAPVILAGAVIVRELMRSGGYDVLTVSENSLLAGAAATIYEATSEGATVIGWMPELSS